MRTDRLAVLAAAMLALLPAEALAASPGRTPQPGGVFKLKPGIFVEEGSTCQDPPNAAILKYDGRGLSGSSVHACRAKVVGRNGRTLEVSQSCIDAGVGQAPRRTDRYKISVENALEFTISRRTDAATYRYCQPRQLPPGL